MSVVKKAYQDYYFELEDWNRGNDLSDGSYTEETLNQITNDLEGVFNGERK